MTKQSLYIVGTRNHCGEDYALARCKSEAISKIEDLLADGFTLSQIVCIEGFQRSIRAQTETLVRNVKIV